MPNHIIVDREGLAEGEDPPGFIETDDYVELGGKDKPDSQTSTP